MTESITTPHALVQTTNGKRFYVYSGVINGGATETSYIDIDNIGERDIRINFEVTCTAAGGSDFKLKFKVNGIIILQDYTRNLAEEYGLGRDEYRFIVPANSSLEVTLQDNASSASANWTVAGHGKYLSM